MPTEMLFTEEKEKGKGYFWLIIFCWLISAVGVAIAIAFYAKLQPEIPLFYSLTEGNGQLADRRMVFLLPLIGILINALHQILLWLGKNYNPFLKRLFALVTLIFELMILVINLRVIWLVI